MRRFLFLAIVMVALAPLVPKYLVPYLDARKQQQTGAGNTPAAQFGGRTYEIPLARNGQYMAEARLNGRSFTMLVDTGASTLALPEQVAKDIGIFLQPSDFKHRVQTANGIALAARAEVRDLRLGPIRLKNVEAMVLENDLLSVPLLGMSALGRLERFDISDDTLVLIQ